MQAEEEYAEREYHAGSADRCMRRKKCNVNLSNLSLTITQITWRIALGIEAGAFHAFGWTGLFEKLPRTLAARIASGRRSWNTRHLAAGCSKRRFGAPDEAAQGDCVHIHLP